MTWRRVRLHAACLMYLGAWVSSVAVPPALGQGGEPRTFAIRGAKVVPVAGAPIENATVVVSRGIITAVGPNAAIPADAWVIDGKGFTVYPGLIDAFTDVGLVAPPPPPPSPPEGAPRPQVSPRPPEERPPASISRGPEDRPATTPWKKAADEVIPADPRVQTWRESGFTTVVAASKSGMFPGQAAVLDLEGERGGDFVVKASVAVPVSFQPSGNFRSFPGSLMGSMAYVRQVWLDTNWYIQAESAYEKNPRVERPTYDHTEASLSDALSKHAVVLIPGNSSLQIRRGLQLAEDWKVSGVLYGAQMAYEVAPEIAAKKMPVLVDLKWPEAEKDSDPEAVPSLRTLRFRDRAPSSPAALERAGVKFAFYSGGLTAPKDLLPAVKKAIDSGLPPGAALRALTLSPAEIFGVAWALGSIEVGKIANLVVTDGDLFDKKTKVKMVFVDGRRFEVREPLHPSEPPKGDLTGKWNLTYTTPEGSEESTADLVMAADGILTGTVSGPRGTFSIFSGWASADKFSFTINLFIQGSPTDVLFSGTFEANSMKGSIRAVKYTVDFTGSRPAPPMTVKPGSAR